MGMGRVLAKNYSKSQKVLGEAQEVRKCHFESSLYYYLLDVKRLLSCVFSLLRNVLLYAFVARTIPTCASDIILYAFFPSFNIFLPTAVRRRQEQGTSALTFVYKFIFFCCKYISFRIQQKQHKMQYRNSDLSSDSVESAEAFTSDGINHLLCTFVLAFIFNVKLCSFSYQNFIILTQSVPTLILSLFHEWIY